MVGLPVWFESQLCPLSVLWILARGLWPQFPYLHNEDKNSYPSGVSSQSSGTLYISLRGRVRQVVSEGRLNVLW